MLWNVLFVQVNNWIILNGLSLDWFLLFRSFLSSSIHPNTAITM